MGALTTSEIESWLRETDPARLADLWRMADSTRRREVGDEVHLRGLVEFSNYCVRQCHYCGLRLGNGTNVRYRMSAAEILECARIARRLGYGTLVLQSGEDPGTSTEWLADVVRRVKDETPLAVTLSVGERDEADLRTWRRAGADRYLLRFETSNAALYAAIHPDRAGRRSDRFAILGQLRELGYEVGSGAMVGIPGQSYADVTHDIELFAELRLDMIGIGPYVPHGDTPLGAEGSAPPIRTDDQVPNTAEMAYKAIALARLMCPNANIPSTTALAAINPVSGRELGLQRGANVMMPNLTPPEYRKDYVIYPGKVCAGDTAEDCAQCMHLRLATIGRRIGTGRGDSLAYHSL
jgi:biotin synthase